MHVCAYIDLIIPREADPQDEDELAEMEGEEMKMRIDLCGILFQEGLIEIDNNARDDDEDDDDDNDDSKSSANADDEDQE